RQVLHDDGRIARNVASEMAHHDAGKEVVAAAGRGADHDAHGLALVERRDVLVGARRHRAECDGADDREQPDPHDTALRPAGPAPTANRRPGQADPRACPIRTSASHSTAWLLVITGRSSRRSSSSITLIAAMLAQLTRYASASRRAASSVLSRQNAGGAAP